MNAKDLRVVKNLFGHIPSMFMKDTTTPPTGGVNPDWNQNDSSKPDFIKNRICYEADISNIYSGSIDLRSTFNGIATGFSFDFSSSVVGTDLEYKLTLNDTEYIVRRSSIGNDKSEFYLKDEEGNYLIELSPYRFIQAVQFTSQAHVVLSKMNGDVRFELETSLNLITHTELPISLPFVFGETCHVEINADSYDFVVSSKDGDLGLFYTSYDKFLSIENYEDEPTYVSTNIESYFNENISLKIDKATIVPIPDKYLPQLGGVQFRIEDDTLYASLNNGASWGEISVG